MKKLQQYLARNPQGYLRHLRRRSGARIFCRNMISELIMSRGIRSLMDVGFGGGNERIMLDDFVKATPKFRWVGVYGQEDFVMSAQSRWPQDEWVLRNLNAPGKTFDVDCVYSTHVLEHCADIKPAFPWMLDSARKLVVIIFFIPLGGIQVKTIRRRICANQYTRYDVSQLCGDSGFSSEFYDFDNRERVKSRHGCLFETVLIARRL